MGAIGGLIGSAGGAAGGGFGGPQASHTGTGGVWNPTSQAEIMKAYDANQAALKQQNDLLAALQGQGGLANQSNVYNQLQDVAAGRGPNPAQAQLAQATAANTANQAALMAGQRGAGANAGLIARQAAMQGGANQQNAAGQAATLQANQSLNALTGAGNMANTMSGQQIGQTNANTSANQAEQAALLNAQLGVNNSNVGINSNINNVNGQMANTTMQGQQGVIGGIMSAVGMGGKMMGGAEGGEVSDLPEVVPVQQEAPQAVAPVQQDQFQTNKQGVSPGNAPNGSTPTFGTDAGAQALADGIGGGGKSGGGGGMSSMLPMLMMLADGGSIEPMQGGLPQSMFGQFLKSGVSASGPSVDSGVQYAGPGEGAKALKEGAKDGTKRIMSMNQHDYNPSVAGPGAGKNMMMMSPAMAQGGQVPALVSPGEQYLRPKDVQRVAQGANPLAVGERIPGKPKHPGNDYRNDIVPKTLETGGIVIPNKVMQSKNPAGEAMKFVHAHMKKNRHK